MKSKAELNALYPDERFQERQNNLTSTTGFNVGDIVRYYDKHSPSYVPCRVVEFDERLLYVERLSDGARRKFFPHRTEKFV